MVDKPKKKIKCLWTLITPENQAGGTWQTHCKLEWDDEDTSKNFKFCPFCGKRILWVIPKS